MYARIAYLFVLYYTLFYSLSTLPVFHKKLNSGSHFISAKVTNTTQVITNTPIDENVQDTPYLKKMTNTKKNYYCRHSHTAMQYQLLLNSESSSPFCMTYFQHKC